MTGEAEIYCPLCAWHPSADDRWQCYPSCDTVWNTFWTRGLCPGCGHQWHETMCLACLKMSPHEKWYHYPEGESNLDVREKESELEHV
jgi:hypothetical protein